MNASDSDDEPDLTGGLHHRYDSPNNVDLEQILRDDDDDIDDDGDIGSWGRTNGSHDGLLNVQNGDHQFRSSDSKSINSHHFSTAHSAEDWAVLQALLGEDHDDTEGVEDDWMHATNGSSFNFKQDVDAILLSDNDDDTSSS